MPRTEVITPTLSFGRFGYRTVARDTKSIKGSQILPKGMFTTLATYTQRYEHDI